MDAKSFERQLATVQEAKKLQEAALLALPNVVGVGVGYKESKGKETKTLAVITYVEKKESERSLAKKDTVPSTVSAVESARVVPFEGRPHESADTISFDNTSVPTDVKEVGRIEAQAFTSRVRPAIPGYSIGHYAITAGTFGCVVRDSCNPCRYYILSNNHVLANSNAATLGDPILQPGPYDGGSKADIIAKLARFVPIYFDNEERYNLVDAALAAPSDPRMIIASIVGLGIPKGTMQATLGMEVVKSGRTTQTTEGKVIDIDATVAVNYGTGVGYFRNQILTSAMSQGGDSGSLLMSKKEQHATGLLFAGSSQITVHNHISNVEMALGVTIVTAS